MDFKELEVWKKAMDLVSMVYTVSKAFPKDELYGLMNQMRRCAVSIPSNIAEGIGRSSTKDTIQFLHISRGSLFELETQVFIAINQGYLKSNDSDTLIAQITQCKKLINGFINYYQKLS